MLRRASQSSLVGASSVGKWPQTFRILRSLACTLSKASVVHHLPDVGVVSPRLAGSPDGASARHRASTPPAPFKTPGDRVHVGLRQRSRGAGKVLQDLRRQGCPWTSVCA